MSQATTWRWRVWRHKNNPAIRYYVEMSPRDPREPNEYLGTTDDPGGPVGMGDVRLRSTRNDAFDEADYRPDLAPEAGMWPREAFEALYEMEEEERC